MGFVQNCTKHFFEKKQEQWLLLTDSDEFLQYNYILPGGENISHFDREISIFYNGGQKVRNAPSEESRAQGRRFALPIRESIQDFHSSKVTFQEFIQAQQANPHNLTQQYFPSANGCTRIVRLTYGIKTTNETQDEILTTKRYQFHKEPTDRFSKVFLDLSKVKEKHLEALSTIHNPFPKLCGNNGRHTSGQDFMGSVLRVNHYVGSLESWLERGGGMGTRVKKQNEESWRQKDSREPDYDGPPDDRGSTWVESFVEKVGPQAADELLFQPLANRIASVISSLKQQDAVDAN